MSLSFIVCYRSFWSWPSTTTLTPPRCWRAHCGGRPNVYTMLAPAARLYVMSDLRLTQTLHHQAVQVLVISPLCFFEETGARQSARAKHQQAVIQVKWGDRRVALRGQSGHLFGQIAYQHGTGQDGGHRQCQEKGVKSGWQSFLYLAKLLRAKNTSHCEVVEKALHPFRPASQLSSCFLWP